MWAPNKREWRLNLKRNKFFGFQLLRASAWMSFPLMEFYTFTIREEQEKEYDTAFDWFLDLWLALARGKKGKLLRVLLSGRWLPGNQGWLNFWETRRFLLLDLCTGSVNFEPARRLFLRAWMVFGPAVSCQTFSCSKRKHRKGKRWPTKSYVPPALARQKDIEMKVEHELYLEHICISLKKIRYT